MQLHCWVISCEDMHSSLLVLSMDRADSWLYCIGKDILSKKSLLGFSPL
jgi:hypothetical protein